MARHFSVGNWKPNTQKNTFTTNDKDGIKEYSILKLSNIELKLEINYDGDSIVINLLKIE
jgi:hypothetical protein